MKAHLIGIAVGLMVTAGMAQAVTMNDAPAQPASSSALSPAQRGAIVEQIVRRWGPFVQQVHKTSIGAWATRMQATFAAANDSNLQRAAGMKTFQGMMGALTGQRLSDAQVMDSLVTQAQVLKSGPVSTLLDPVNVNLSYTSITPCRIADTRVPGAGGPIAGGTSRGFHGYTTTNFASQGGISTSNCGIPPNPPALMLNVTVVSPTAAGYLTVFPFGTTQPTASNLNYAIGAVVGNEIAARMAVGSATDEFSVFAFGTTNVVVDVVGIFMSQEAAVLDCTNASSIVQVPAHGSILGDAFCPVGFSATGGGCLNTSSNNQLVSSMVNSELFECGWVNSSSTTSPATVSVRCCRTPGR